MTFTTTTAGQAAYGIAVGIGADIIADVNAANVPNITASASGPDVVLTNSTGGAITIVNTSNDGQGNPAGTSSGTGWELSTGASSGAYLKLTRADGGEILLDDVTGTPLSDLGIYSVHNGRHPLAVTVEQGIVAGGGGGGTTVVADITARNALSPTTGDTVYVIDSGNGEYAFFVYNGSAWNLLADEDSANTDANTLSATVTQGGGSGTTAVGTVPDGSRITLVSIEVTVAFDDSNATLTIGDSGDADRLVSDSELDLTSTGTYAIQPAYQYTTGSDATINAYLNIGS